MINYLYSTLTKPSKLVFSCNVENGGISIDEVLIAGSVNTNFSNTSMSTLFVKVMNGFFGWFVAAPGTNAFNVSFTLPGVLAFNRITT